MEHTEKKQVRRFEINLVSIMQAQDNLHDQMRGFIRDVVSHLKANLFPQLEKSNVRIEDKDYISFRSHNTLSTFVNQPYWFSPSMSILHNRSTLP